MQSNHPCVCAKKENQKEEKEENDTKEWSSGIIFL